MNTVRRWVIALVAIFFIGIFPLGGYALAQMGPGMMGPRQQQGQQQQPSQQPGPGMMGPGMMGPGGQMGQGMMGPGGMMGGGMMGAGATNDRPWITVMLDHREELGLSAEQVGKLFVLRDGFAKDARTKGEALEGLERDLDQLVGPGAVDLQAVEAKLREAEALRTNLRLSRLRVIEEGKAILTSAQRGKFVELAKQ